MLALEDAAAITASMVSCRSADGGTIWRAAWLSRRRTTHCEAERTNDPDWTFGPGHQDEPRVEAWSASLSEIATSSVSAARAGIDFNSWAADIRGAITFKDGRSFTAPLFDEWGTQTEREQAETFLNELRKTLTES